MGFQPAYGWRIGDPRLDWNHLIEARNREIARLNGIYRNMLEKAGVRIIEGWGRITGPNAVEVGGESFTAERILVAVGAKPSLLDVPGIEHVITSNEALEGMTEQPRRLFNSCQSAANVPETAGHVGVGPTVGDGVAVGNGVAVAGEVTVGASVGSGVMALVAVSAVSAVGGVVEGPSVGAAVAGGRDGLAVPLSPPAPAIVAVSASVVGVVAAVRSLNSQIAPTDSAPIRRTPTTSRTMPSFP